MKELNVLIVGVGGQGTLLASRVLGKYALGEGCDVKLSEVHGMAQRGGSVMTYVRLGEKIASPEPAPTAETAPPKREAVPPGAVAEPTTFTQLFREIAREQGINLPEGAS